MTFNRDIICPAPEVYEKGLAVVAFLARRDDGGWHTVGLSYGVRYPADAQALAALRQAVQGARRAQAEADAAGARTRWQVQASAHPETRWDGLYGLVPDADEDHAFYDPQGARAQGLTPELQALLARGFTAHPPVGRDLPMMLAALRGHADAQVDGAAARALETVLTGEAPPRWARLALELLRARYGEAGAARAAPQEDPLLRTFEDGAGGAAGPRASEPSSLRSEWEAFKQRHRLTPAPLAPPAEPLVSGLGGETPL